MPERTPIEEKSLELNDNLNYKFAPDSILVLGKQLENPSTVEVMEQAYQNVIKSTKARLTTEKSPVRVTHLYIQFRPKDWEEYDLIKNENNRELKLFDYPLDREIILHGNKYQDLEVPLGKPTYQYSVVPKNYKFNQKVKYKVLSEAYLPEFDESIGGTKNGRMSTNNEFVEIWINESLRLTKNYDFMMKPKKALKSAWIPSGNVKSRDTRFNAPFPNFYWLKDFPLEGVQIRVHRFLTTYTTYTNASGDYNMAPFGFTFPAQYSLYFETPNFDIRSGAFGQAWVSGPRQDTPWNVIFGTYDISRFYADVFRGAYRYSYGNTFGLAKPNFFWGNAVKYGAYDQYGSQHDSGPNWLGIFNNIRIYRYGDFGELKSDNVFSSTIHETAHTTHRGCMNGGTIQFEWVSDFILESWATAIQVFLTKDEYRNRGILNYGSPYYTDGDNGFNPLNFGRQEFTKANVFTPNYSNLFIDLNDDFNQFGNVNYIHPISGLASSYSGHKDEVCCFSYPAIESGYLKHVYGLNSLSDNLKQNKPSGVTDSQINDLISQY